MKIGFRRQLAALAAAVPGTVSLCHAQGAVQIYGTIDLAVGQLANQNAGPPTTGVTELRSVHNGGLQTSYIGFRGSEDLGGGLSARFQLESFLRVNNGLPGRFDASPASAADPFWSRSSFVALAGGFGELRLGNVGNPMWVSMLQTNALGANSVFSPSFRQLFNGGTRGRSVIDTAMVNSVGYLTPAFNGLSATVVVQAAEGRGNGHNHAASVTWRSGPLLASVSVQRARHAPLPRSVATADQDIVLAGAAYDFGPLRAFAQYTTIDNVGNKSKLPHFGVTAPIGAGTLQFSHGEDRNTVAATGAVAQRTTDSLGYVYGLSRRTDLYGFAMRETFPVVGPADKRGDSFVLGISHRF